MNNGRIGYPEATIAARVSQMQALIEKFSVLPHAMANQAPGKPRRQSPAEKVILLTGTTGNLGSDLLAVLLNEASVKRVYALNRTSALGPSRDRVGEQFVDKGLPEHLLDSSKVVLVDGDLTHPKLGLNEFQYEQLRHEITIVIHNAWPVGQTQPLSRFESSLLGLSNLITFGRSIPEEQNPRFVFISSCVAALLWRVYEKKQPAPEKLIDDPRVAFGFGYAESKYIAEHILARSGLNATSLRVTQLAGRLGDGTWPSTEWLPLILKLSVHVGVLPLHISKKLLPFIPLDVAARCISEICLSSNELPEVLNVSHPRPHAWQVLDAALGKLVLGKPAKYVPVLEWTDIVEKEVVAKLTGSAQRHVGRILDLKHLCIPSNPVLDNHSLEVFPAGACSTEKAQELSATLRNLPSLGKREYEKFIAHWVKIGFLEPKVEAPVGAKL